MIFTGLLIALITQLEPLVEWLTPFADGWTPGLATTIRVLIGTALGAGAVLIMVISFTTLTLALGSPLYDKLSESVEREFGDVPELNENVARGLGRALRQAVALIAVAVLGALMLFATGFVPVVGQTVVPVLSAIFGGWMLGIELVGAPFERRGNSATGGSPGRYAGTAAARSRFRSAHFPAPRHPVRGGCGVSSCHSRRHPARPSAPRRAHVACQLSKREVVQCPKCPSSCTPCVRL